jgi:hypothetical protein
VGATGAVAGGLITSKKIKDNTIKSRDVRDGALTGTDIANGSVGGADVADGSLAGGDIADGSVSGADINGSTDGLIKAAAKVESNGDLGSSFNRLGGAITASQTGTGDYTVNIPGATGTTISDKIVGVTAYNSLAECKPWLGSGSTMTVRCYDTNTQTLRNASFSVWLIK